jgi:hypothetical protein
MRAPRTPKQRSLINVVASLAPHPAFGHPLPASGARDVEWEATEDVKEEGSRNGGTYNAAFNCASFCANREGS